MKTLKNISNYIDNILTKWSIDYIDKVSKTLYPKPHLKDDDKPKEEEENEDNEPILFI